MQTLKYYVKSVYGCDKEYLHPDNTPIVNDAIQCLTRQKTVTPHIRESLRYVSNQSIQWEQVLPPAITH